MSGSVEKMVLCCAYCGIEAEEDAVIEAYQLHTQVEHGADEVNGMLMEHTSSNGALDYFRCPAGHVGSVRMKRGK